ncbi:hypothetical protein B0H13DRAFT_2668731 [Mycena leptocephala]|nr:hypothetical protein B0H13DRAFT_2668731 [Mycena leptocephala]
MEIDLSPTDPRLPPDLERMILKLPLSLGSLPSDHDSKYCLLVYDLTSRRSFENVRTWLADVRTHADAPVNCILATSMGGGVSVLRWGVRRVALLVVRIPELLRYRRSGIWHAVRGNCAFHASALPYCSTALVRRRLLVLDPFLPREWAGLRHLRVAAPRRLAFSRERLYVPRSRRDIPHATRIRGYIAR